MSGLGLISRIQILANEQNPQAAQASPNPTPVEFKSSTPAGGLRDITREAVRVDPTLSSPSGTTPGLGQFYPDYLKNK